MRKFFVATAIVLTASVAFAGSLYIPFFFDNGSLTAGRPNSVPFSGNATFITLANTTGSDIVLTVQYRDNAGTQHSVGTYLLGASGGLAAFRPVIDDSGNEIPGFPKMPGGKFAGSLQLTWPGGADSDVVGRQVEINSNGQSMMSVR